MNTKHFYSLGLLALTVTLQYCATPKETAFTFPDEASTDVRGDFSGQFERGRILYGINCGGCHNVKEGRKTIIPDFSLAQLLDYEMRTQYPEHGEELREARVSKEELDDIQVFLQYRKPSGHPVTLPPMPQSPPKVNE